MDFAACLECAAGNATSQMRCPSTSMRRPLPGYVAVSQRKEAGRRALSGNGKREISVRDQASTAGWEYHCCFAFLRGLQFRRTPTPKRYLLFTAAAAAHACSGDRRKFGHLYSCGIRAAGAASLPPPERAKHLCARHALDGSAAMHNGTT